MLEVGSTTGRPVVDTAGVGETWPVGSPEDTDIRIAVV